MSRAAPEYAEDDDCQRQRDDTQRIEDDVDVNSINVRLSQYQQSCRYHA